MTSCMMLFVLIGVFTYIKMSFLIKGVQIIANIEHREDTSVIIVRGVAKNANFISLNGREIFIDKDGSFSESIALIPGVSVVTINTEDKFGKSNVWKKQIVYKGGIPSVAFKNQIININ